MSETCPDCREPKIVGHQVRGAVLFWECRACWRVFVRVFDSPRLDRLARVEAEAYATRRDERL